MALNIAENFPVRRQTVCTHTSMSIIKAVREYKVAREHSRVADKRAVCEKVNAMLDIARGNGLNIPAIVSAANSKALQLAIESENDVLVKLLLDNGARPNEICFSKISRLHSGIRIRRMMMSAANLVERNVQRIEIDPRTNRKHTVERTIIQHRVHPKHFDEFFTAACVDSPANRRMFIDKLRNKGVHINSATNDGWTALHHAVRYSTVANVGFVLRLGANINCQDSNGYTPLMTAVNERKPEMVRALLDAGAKLNVADRNGWTPLHLAAATGNEEIITMLLTSRQVARDRELLNVTDKHNWTPLQLATLGEGEQHTRIHRRLTEAGAGISRGTTATGITPYRHAVQTRNAAKVIALRRASQDVRRTRADWSKGHRKMSYLG